MIALITIIVYVLSVNFNKLDTVKSQGVQLRSQYTYEFNITEQMKYVGAVYFWTEKLFPRVDPDFPEDYEEFTEEQKKKLSDFLCKNTRMYIHDEMLDDTIGIDPFSTETFFDLTCRVMPWANDKIRINYLAGVAGIRTIGKKIDTRDYDYKKPTLDEIDKYEETENLKFSLYPNYKIELIVDFNPMLDGLDTMIVIITTDDADQDAYNSYVFSDPPSWDKFWFDEQSRMLLYSNTYTLGKQQLELGQIRCQPEKNIHLKRIEKQKVLGFTVSYDDRIEETVIWGS